MFTERHLVQAYSARHGISGPAISVAKGLRFKLLRHESRRGPQTPPGGTRVYI
jgi:hypothetical protein